MSFAAFQFKVTVSKEIALFKAFFFLTTTEIEESN